MPRLLNHGSEPIILHGGVASCFKIDCDALGPQDCDAVAYLLGPQLRPFGSVEAIKSTSHVPQWMAAAFLEYVAGRDDPPLIVDDVYTTGMSMEGHRGERDAVGVVIFARATTPDWITPLFMVNPRVRT